MEDVSGILIDSDVLIDYLRGVEGARVFLLRTGRKTELSISAVGVAEIYAGEETRHPKKRERIEIFLQNFEITDVNPSIARRAGELVRDYRRPFADMIVAATAINRNLRLATRNTKHYRGLKGLKLLHPY